MNTQVLSLTQTEHREEQAMAPLLAAYPSDQLPDPHVLQAMARRVGLWSLVQSAGALAREYGYARFRVRTAAAAYQDTDDPRWNLELCFTARDIHDPDAIVDAFNYGGEADLDEALLLWTRQQAVAPADDLPSGFKTAVVDRWLDPAQVETLRSTILGAPAVALWRAQAAAQAPTPADAAHLRRPRARS